jgi:membrane protein implicated in regulation of membrane protease activity
MVLWTEWWFWVSAALVLAILEVIVPGFFALGFAIGALIVGAGMGLGLLGVSLGWTLVIFAIFSLGGTLLLRHFFKLEKGQVKTWDTDIND